MNPSGLPLTSESSHLIESPTYRPPSEEGPPPPPSLTDGFDGELDDEGKVKFKLLTDTSEIMLQIVTIIGLSLLLSRHSRPQQETLYRY